MMNEEVVMRETLAEIEAKRAAKLIAIYPDWTNTRTWDQYQVKSEYAVGKAGAKRTGSDLHLLTVDRIIGETGDHKPNTLKVGQLLSSRASCGIRSNGQHTAHIIPGADTDKITCERCIKHMGW
jgi:hypothetical protein